MPRIAERPVNDVHHHTCFHLSVFVIRLFIILLSCRNIHRRRKAATGWKTKMPFLCCFTMPAIRQAGVILHSLPLSKGVSQKWLEELAHHHLQGVCKGQYPEACSNKTTVGTEHIFSQSFEWSRRKEYKEVPYTRRSQQWL